MDSTCLGLPQRHRLTPIVQMPTPQQWAGVSVADRPLLDHTLRERAEFIDHPRFHEPHAKRRLFGNQDEKCASGILTGPREVMLFLQFNYARRRQFRILFQVRDRRLSLAKLRDLLIWARKAMLVRNRIVEANTPLVLAMARRFRFGNVDYDEIISEGNLALLRCVDQFDCSRGFKFSTYACRAILKSFSRVALKTSRYRGRFPCEFDPSLEVGDPSPQRREEQEALWVEGLHAALKTNSAELSEIERTVLSARFRLDRRSPASGTQTLEQIGTTIGVTKERVRQIQNKALQKLRQALEEGPLGMVREPRAHNRHPAVMEQ